MAWRPDLQSVGAGGGARAVLEPADATKPLKELATSNARLRRLLGEVQLDKDLLQPVVLIHVGRGGRPWVHPAADGRGSELAADTVVTAG